MGRCPFLLLSLVRTLPLLLLLLLLVLQQAHGAPSPDPSPSYQNCGLPESNQTRAYNDFEKALIQVSSNNPTTQLIIIVDKKNYKNTTGSLSASTKISSFNGCIQGMKQQYPALSKPRDQVCVVCTSTFWFSCECCSEVVKAWGVGSYPTDRLHRSKTGCQVPQTTCFWKGNLTRDWVS